MLSHNEGFYYVRMKIEELCKITLEAVVNKADEWKARNPDRMLPLGSKIGFNAQHAVDADGNDDVWVEMSLWHKEYQIDWQEQHPDFWNLGNVDAFLKSVSVPRIPSGTAQLAACSL